MNKRIFNLIIAVPFFASLVTQAQVVGINVSNTVNPKANLELHAVDGLVSNNVLQISNSSKALLLIQKNEGSVGIGVAQPKVLVDVRANNVSAISVGTTSQTAADARMGALRYNQTDKTLESSDGTRWAEIATGRQRAVVLANLWHNSTLLPNAKIVNLVNWSIDYDQLMNFNGATGIFTAPHDGFYFATVTGNLAAGRITKAGSSFEVKWLINNVQKAIGITSFMSVPNPVVYSIQGSVSSSATFVLKKGDKLRTQMYQDTGSDRSLRITSAGSAADGGAGFNNLFIVEY